MDNGDYFKLAVEAAAPEIRELPSDRGRAPGSSEEAGVALIERYFKMIKAASAKLL